MARDSIRIAHLSDLHFTAYNEGEDYYGQLLSDLENEIKPRPDLMVVTGDIADNKGWQDIFINLKNRKLKESANSLFFLLQKKRQLRKSLHDALFVYLLTTISFSEKFSLPLKRRANSYSYMINGTLHS